MGPEEILSGPRLNIKTVLSTYGDFHVKDKTAVRTYLVGPSFLLRRPPGSLLLNVFIQDLVTVKVLRFKVTNTVQLKYYPETCAK